jgi:hypothetical protein
MADVLLPLPSVLLLLEKLNRLSFMDEEDKLDFLTNDLPVISVYLSKNGKNLEN